MVGRSKTTNLNFMTTIEFFYNIYNVALTIKLHIIIIKRYNQ
jgi:hypothetical protein